METIPAKNYSSWMMTILNSPDDAQYEKFCTARGLLLAQSDYRLMTNLNRHAALGKLLLTGTDIRKILKNLFGRAKLWNTPGDTLEATHARQAGFPNQTFHLEHFPELLRS